MPGFVLSPVVIGEIYAAGGPSPSSFRRRPVRRPRQSVRELGRGVAKRRIDLPLRQPLGPDEAGAFEVRPVEVGAFEARSVEVGVFEARPAEVGAFEARPVEVGAFEVRRVEVGVFEVRPVEAGAFEVRRDEVGAFEVRLRGAPG
jgi:hypothetical protein